MCGIAGLFSKSLDVSESLGSHLGDMLLQLSDRGPDSAGVAIYRDPAPSGSSKVSLFSPDPAAGLVRSARRARRGVRRGRARAARKPRGDRRGDGRRRGTGLAARALPRAARDERRAGDRDLQGGGSAARLHRELRPRRHPGQPRARPHAHGHREPRDHRALAPVLHRARPLPGAQRLAVEPQPPAPPPARRGHRVPDRQRHRGGRRLPDLAAARGRVPRAGARGLPRGPRRLLHVRGRHDRRLRGAARPDRLQAGGDGGDRRLGRDGVRVPGDRRAAGRRDARAPGSRSLDASTAGSGPRSDGRSRERPRGCRVRPGGLAAARAERRAALRGRRRPAALAGAEPARGARARRGDRRPDRGRDRGPRGLLLRRHEQAGDRARARQRRRGRGREHHVRDGDRGGQHVAVRGRHGPRRAARDPRQRLGALRDLDEGRGHRRAGLGGPHERVHGAEGLPGGVRRRRRGVRRLDL